MVEIVREGGRILIYVWAYEQDNLSFREQDVFVPWNLQKKYGEQGVYKRYYHVFKYEEIKALVEEIENAYIEELFYDKSNWAVIIRKK